MKKHPLSVALVSAVLVFAGGCAVDDKTMGPVSTAYAQDNFGQTPPELADLVGARGGQAEGALTQRGYEYRSGSKSGDSSYTNWEELSTGECVTIRSREGRYESIIYGSRIDCESSSDEMAGGDALVAGTDFNATGQIPCSMSRDQPTASCSFGVNRESNGGGFVTVTRPDGSQRVIFFENGQATGYDQSQADSGEFRAGKRGGDLNVVRIGSERYEIPDAVIYGG